MKRIKRLASLLLATIMVLAMGTTVFALNNEGDGVENPPDPSATTYSITINNKTPGHTYEAYQIFAGDLFEEKDSDGKVIKKTLSNIVWGSGVTEAGQKELGDAAEAAKAITQDNVAAFAQNVSKYLSTPAGTTNTVENEKYEITNLPAGYYLIRDKDGSLESGADDNYTTFILEVVSNAEATPKNSGTPESDKKVKDKNDSDATDATDWQYSADYDIGDQIPYQLKAKLPDTVAAYDTYKLIFHDVLSEGLTFDGVGTVKVSVKTGDATTEIEEGYAAVYDETKRELTITFADVKAKPVNATNGSEIYVEYTATLNEKAKIGAEGNINTLTLEYSNDPNSEGNGDSTGTTPETTVIVFTFETVVNKVDEKNEPLAGAAFKLEKLVKTEEGKDAWEEIGAFIAGTDTSFTFSGLDDGKYKLTETTTPDGYNTIKPIYFVIKATHGATNEGIDALEKLEVLATDEEWTPLTGENVTKFDVTTSTGNATTNVVNQSGTVLPSTGGIGTTIFYVIGGILVVAAGVLLVTKKRMKAE